ncbi:hypothetical protein IW143_002882 [Coemansia sp. RSA 520]|nr:hypothetical protein IW143_002882 [Coemansia sp. RSA 520]KAJ2434652.1 hypothetical protein IWW41_001348 [Coemansia sp. RSA 2522]
MSRHEHPAPQPTQGLSRGERRLQELLDHLKSVETSRSSQVPILESINHQHATDVLNKQLLDDYSAATQLAQQEQRSASSALEIVNRLLARMEAREAEQEAERQTAKRQKMEQRSSPVCEPYGKDRRMSRSGDSAPNLEKRRGSETTEPRDWQRRGSVTREPSGRDPTGRDSRRDRSRTRDPSRNRDPSRDPRRDAPRIISKGSLVAARVAAAGEGDEEWILATVLSFSSEKNRYTVQDYDVESPVRPTYVLSPRLVLFVTSDPTLLSSKKKPLWDKLRNPEMPRGQRVLALYPRTTAFYQCLVVVPPSLNTSVSSMLFPPAPGVPMGPADPSLGAPPDPTANPMYKVQFDDDNGNLVDVPAHLVIPMMRSGH